MSKRIFFQFPDQLAVSYYRAELPVTFCAPILADEGIQLVGDTTLYEHMQYDAIIIHRALTPQFFPVCKELQKAGKKVIWTVDDDYTSVPEWNPAYQEYSQPEVQDSIARIAELADEIWVSTPGLKERWPKAKVLPNLLDPRKYWARPTPPPYVHQPVRVLWAGSNSHGKDLEVLAGPVKRLVDVYGDHVCFLFWGYLPDGLAEPVRNHGDVLARVVAKRAFGTRVLYCPPVANSDYARCLQEIICPHIALAPLCDHVFNRGKSNIKWCEMSLAGAAFIATQSEPYRMVRNGQSGLLVRDEDEWYWALRRLIEDVHYRYELVQAAQADVRACWTWETSAKETWLDAFRAIV